MEQVKWSIALWRFLRPAVIAVGIVVVGAALSFLVAGEFSFPAYGERLFWGGIGLSLLGGFAVVASLGAYSTLGTPSVLTAPADARIAHSRVGEYMETNARRYGFTIRMVVAGALCIGLSALVNLLAG
ncbi:MAG TPA: hypothetical protein VM366_14305 [Anaerolineae bacterium]|nr:hypothetical protein [Anaerolineae bacterium]